MGLGKKAAKGGAVIMVGQVLKIVAQLINLIVLARLLGPSEFGLVAMVLSVYGLGEVVRDFGLSTASLQAKEITKAQVSNLFWLNLCLGCSLAGIAYYLADSLAVFFDRNELVDIGHLMCLMFIFNGISAQYKAQLNRKLKFLQMTMADVAGAYGGVLAGMFFAYYGFGYWAIVVQQLTQFFIQMVLYVYFGKWLPNLPDLNAPMKHFFTFGWNLMAAQILNYLTRSFPSILIGNKFGAVSLGLYDRAFQILMLPLNQLNAPSSSVAIPILSRLNHEDEIKYNKFIVFGQNVMVHIVVFFLALAATQTENLVIKILGDEWVGLVPVFRYLSLSGVFLALSYACYWIFVSKGITHSIMTLTLVSKPILIIITALGSFWGVEGVALFYSIGLMVNWLIGIYWVRNTGVPIKEMILGPMWVVVCYFSASAMSYYIMGFYKFDGYSSIIIGWLIMLVILCVMYVVIPKFRHSINSLMSIRQYLRK